VVAQRLAEVDPDDVLAHTSLSVLYQKKGMIPEAEAEGAKAECLDGAAVEEKLARAWSYELRARKLSARSSKLSTIHTSSSMPERAVGDSESVGSLGLHTAALLSAFCNSERSMPAT